MKTVMIVVTLCFAFYGLIHIDAEAIKSFLQDCIIFGVATIIASGLLISLIRSIKDTN